MNVTLGPALEDFVQRKIAQGVYASADEMIAASLAILRTDEDEDWRSEGQAKIEQGIRSARAGRVHEPAAVAAWMKAQKAAWQTVPPPE